MELIQELLSNASATYQLKQRYYWLTTLVGLAAVAFAIGLLLLTAKVFSLLNSSAAIMLFIVAIPFVFYLAGILVAGTFGLIMVWLKQFTPDEAWYYALRSRYPARWFRNAEDY